MPVFLSHKREDKAKALEIESYLKVRGVRCYVDVMDPDLQSTDDITSKLRERIGQCTHLMAVVSGYTEKSWWVPFEIGVGTEKDRRITSYQIAQVKLPDFLTKWPILKSARDLDLFISLYKEDSLTVNLESYTPHSSTIKTADQFHRNLKARL